MPLPAQWERLRELAQQRADAYALRLAEVTRGGADAEHKLELLREYRREYVARLAAAGRDGIHGEGLRNYRAFLANLERAIEQQARVVAQWMAIASAHGSSGPPSTSASSPFGVLHDRTVAAGQRAERRQQQKHQDELANRPLPRFLSGAD